MTLPEKIKKYGLTQKDWFQHKHYTIITRMGIDKIQAFESIKITFEPVTVQPEFCVVKAIGVKDTLTVETFGSSKYGAKEWNPKKKDGKGGWDEFGNTTTWYVMEMAEKRAMSRVVLKITGFYELGVFGEDESEDFKPEVKEPTKKVEPRKESLKLSQYNAVIISKNIIHIKHFLETCKMEDAQRKELERIMLKDAEKETK